jgi:uncharacterized membrane protein
VEEVRREKFGVFLVLIIWFVIGLGLRLLNLAGKPPWTDEFSTLVFSLGNSFLTVPLDRAIAINTLLQPLQPQVTAGVGDVLSHLLTESNHPPLYFVLTHWWTELFPTQQGLVSLWGARSLAVIFGALSIPAIYGLSWIAFRSTLISQLAAAMMAVSPFSVFLAQEARHYTLAILWVIASLACFMTAIRHIHNQTKLSLGLIFCWILTNALGIASHYFFVLTLCMEAGVLIFLAWRIARGREKPILPFLKSPWKQIYLVAAGSFVAGLVWLPIFLQNSYGNQLTEWIQGDKSGLAWLSPIVQALAAWVTMICLLPVESSHLGVIIASGLGMIVFFVWATPLLWRGVKVRLQSPETSLITLVLISLIAVAIALFLIFTYFLGIDLTRGARYNFVYFPVVIVLLAASLGVCWQNSQGEMQRWGIGGRKAVVLIWLMGFFSVITVVSNLGYQKYYRPDLFVELIANISNQPILIATTHKTHVHIGEMMGVAREFKLTNSRVNPLFLLAHQQENPQSSTTSLENTLKVVPRPLDVWLVNFHTPIPTSVKQCKLETRSLPAIDGYEYQLYHCP